MRSLGMPANEEDEVDFHLACEAVLTAAVDWIEENADDVEATMTSADRYLLAAVIRDAWVGSWLSNLDKPSHAKQSHCLCCVFR